MKKKILLPTTMAALLVIVSSCDTRDIIDSGNNLQNPTEIEATFRTTIDNVTTRASGTLWEAGDEIGVYAIKAGETLSESAVYDGKKNIKYVNNVNGGTANFTAYSEKIKFPGAEEFFDFIAYYPYTSTASSTDFTIDIDISEQSQHSKIDFMYAKSNGYSSENPEVNLTFKHTMSQLVLYLTSDSQIDIEGASVTIHNAVTQGSMNLKDGVVTPNPETSAEGVITPLTTYNHANKTITATAIMLPGWYLSDAEIHIHTADNIKYVWKPDNYKLSSNTIRSYKLNLTSLKVEMIMGGSTIDEWLTDPTNDAVDITPFENKTTGENKGDGTKNNPYSVEQAIEKQGETGVWVQGYIIGWAEPDGYRKFKVGTDIGHSHSSANIVLAPDISEENTAMIPIKFAAKGNTTIKEELNLKSNNHLIGRKIKVLCDLTEVYQSFGGDQISDYEFLD